MLLRLPVIAALDADHDGVISAEEIAGASAALKKLDRNEDGMIDFLEMRPPGGPPEGRGPGGSPMDRPRGERGPEGRGPEGRGPEGRGPFRGRPDGAERPGGLGRGGFGQGGFGQGGDAFLDRLMERDEDGDELLSADELPPFMARTIERADANDDGKLSREELKKAMAQRGRGMRRGGRPGAERDTPGGERPKRPPLEE